MFVPCEAIKCNIFCIILPLIWYQNWFCKVEVQFKITKLLKRKIKLFEGEGTLKYYQMNALKFTAYHLITAYNFLEFMKIRNIELF